MNKIDIIPPCFLCLLSIRIFVLKEFYFHSGSIQGAQAQSAAVVVSLFSLVWLWQLFLKRIITLKPILFRLVIAELGTGIGVIGFFASFDFDKPSLWAVLITTAIIAYTWMRSDVDSGDAEGGSGS